MWCMRRLQPYVTKAVSARIMKTAAEQLDELDDETAAECVAV